MNKSKNSLQSEFGTQVSTFCFGMYHHGQSDKISVCTHEKNADSFPHAHFIYFPFFTRHKTCKFQCCRCPHTSRFSQKVNILILALVLRYVRTSTMRMKASLSTMNCKFCTGFCSLFTGTTQNHLMFSGILTIYAPFHVRRLF